MSHTTPTGQVCQIHHPSPQPCSAVIHELTEMQQSDCQELCTKTYTDSGNENRR